MSRQTRRIAILDAPSNLGLKPPAEGQEPGVKQMAQALRSQNLLQRLGAVDAGMVEAPAYHDFLDPRIGVRNAEGLVLFAKALAIQIRQLLEQDQFPLVLGGDCSILLGSTLALRQLGRYGLRFIDGHTDLLTPADSITGGAAGMDLALVMGTVPELLTNIEGKKPYVRPEDAILFGFRCPGTEESTVAQPPPSMRSFPLSKIRAQGISVAAEEAVTHLESSRTLGFWLHLDVDVLSPEWMFAVDSPDPGGLTPEELAALLKTVSRNKWCAGIQITIYDPTLDPEGRCASLITELLVSALA
jgi:arginase